jgi:hypothetical protein
MKPSSESSDWKMLWLNDISCHPGVFRFSISDISDIAQIIIALVNILLAGYIFLRQNRQNEQTRFQTARLNEQNIKLQWFKELIVQPCMPIIETFFINLHTLKDKIQSNDLTVEQKEGLNNFVKGEASIFRKGFLDILLSVDPKLAEKISTSIDEVVDGITLAIFNDELKLNLPTTYEKHIGSKISYAKSNLIGNLYNYSGLPN